ncbi:MAG: NMD3-related protein [Candidatus Nanoarchaeia archaeon]
MQKKDIHNAQYFEGILQLRNVTAEILEYVENQIEMEDQHVAKIVNLKGGKDYYMGDNKFILKLGKKLKEKFSGDLKTSSSLYSVSKETSKEIHRLTVLFRHVPFKYGTILNWRGKKIKVTRLGPKVEIKDTATGKHELVTYEELLKNATAAQ